MIQSSFTTVAQARAKIIVVRDELEQETRQYAQRPNAKEFYVDRRNRQLSHLYDAADRLQPIGDALVYEVGQVITDWLNNETCPDSILIRIDRRPNVDPPLCYPTNLYDQP